MKKLLIILGLLACSFVTGCYDMQYEDMEEYYDYFDDTVYLKYIGEDGVAFESESASIEDNFLNKQTQDHFSEDCLIDCEYYSYLAVCLNSDEETVFDDLCLYIRAEEDVLMEIRVYVVDELPSHGRGFNAEPKSNEGSYDDEYGNPVATVLSNFKVGEFHDIFVRKWTIDGSQVKYITLQPDQYLLVQFYNNTGYGKESDYKSVKFTMTDFVLSKVSN